MDLDKIRHILNMENAEFKGVDHQIDTYFNVNAGRLKLREGNIENSLIHYKRENKAGAKESDVMLYKSLNNKILKEVLISAVGVLVVVDKKREIYFIDNVKFHLDKVETLGSFIEIEAIGNEDANKEELMKQCKYYLKLFKVDEKDLVAVSYSDMIQATKRD